MKLKTGVLGLLAVVMGWGLPVAQAQEKEMVDNPLYKHWAAYKPGAFAKLKSSSVVQTPTGEMKTDSETTYTLLELTPDKAVLEIKTAVAGVPPQTIKNEIRAKEAKGDSATQPAAGQKVDMTEGEETIDVLGKQVKTKWTKIVNKQGDSTTISKTWTSEAVPNLVVKSEIVMEGPTKMKVVTLLAEYKTEK